MAYDITNERNLDGQAPYKTFKFTDASATTAWTDTGLGAQGIKFLRVLVYATAAVAATFQVAVAEDGSGTNAIVVSDTSAATSAAAAFEFRCAVPVAAKDFFRIVLAGTSATFDAIVQVYM